MKNKRAVLPAVPYVGWMAVFVVIPLILIVVYAFTNEGGTFTLDNFAHMGDYVGVFARSMWLALIATTICLLIGYPLAYAISKEPLSVQRALMMLIMLPMWMNFLLRTYAWMSILENTGLLNHLFAKIGLIGLVNHLNIFLNGAFGSSLPTNLQYFKMINTEGAVVLGMVYNFLPFMVLPIQSVIVKIDSRVIEAAQDLGADSRITFRRVIFPLSLPGVLSGVTMVFVPSVSTFVISKLLGGGGSMLLGDLIEMQFLGTAYNPHLGSAISLLMMIIVMICMAVMNRFGEGEEQAVML
jgi:ABC-type spermidine/putrescine transport system, permease component I